MKNIGSVQITDAQLREAAAGRAEGDTNYIGAGDNLLDFGKAKSFVEEDETQKRFKITISNASAADEVIVLNPGFRSSFTGKSIIADGTIKNSVTASGSPQSIAQLLGYIKNNPTRLRKIDVKVDDVAQMEEAIVLRKETPFQTPVEVQKVPSDYVDGDTNNPKAATIDDVKDWVLSGMTEMETKVQAGRTITLSFLFGASVDTTEAVNKKAEEAAYTVARAYVAKKA